MVVLSSLFVEILICDMVVAQCADLFNDCDACKVNLSCLNSMNKNNQNFHQIQKVLLSINLSQKTQGTSVEC